jgi:hypothetical protein
MEEIQMKVFKRKSAVPFLLIGDSPPKYKSLRVWSEKVGDPKTRLKSPHGIEPIFPKFIKS